MFNFSPQKFRLGKSTSRWLGERKQGRSVLHSESREKVRRTARGRYIHQSRRMRWTHAWEVHEWLLFRMLGFAFLEHLTCLSFGCICVTDLLSGRNLCQGQSEVATSCRPLLISVDQHIYMFFPPSHSHPQARGPWSQSGRVGFSRQWHRHPRHVPVLPHLLPAGAIQSGPSQEGGTEQVGLEKGLS